jgi:processive 1,2-diacylglycerol beta-glucosyltransferase
MVDAPRLGRLRIPARLTQRWRAQLRAQRRWWRRQWLDTSSIPVMFPSAGHGAVAIGTLASGAESQGPRIAILHATAGSGHKRAAQALAAALTELQPGATVREVDTLIYASRFYRSTYAASYNTMASRAPALWGALYHSWENAPVNRGTAPMRLALDRLNLRRLTRVLERESPDAVVCTHFLPVEALSPSRGHGRLRVPLYCVITDFTAHPIWAFPHVDRYFVASQTVAEELAARGVQESRIEVTGIPVDPVFSRHVGRDESRARLGLDARGPVVLVMGGGSGVGPLSELADRLAALALAPQVVVVCGTNERRLREIAARPAARTGRIVPMGFTNDVNLLLEASDVIVTKAGGRTCSEALIKRTPLVIFRPTPGQEVRNAQFLETGGAALHAETVSEVEATVGRWLADAGERERVREAEGRLARPNAASDIARRVLQGIPKQLERIA